MDPDGRKIIGKTDNDAKKALADFQQMFSGERFKEFRKLLSVDGNSFNSIDSKQLEGAVAATNN